MELISSIKLEVGFLGTKFVKRGETIGYTNNNLSFVNEDTMIGLVNIGYSKFPFAKQLLFDVKTNKRRFIAESIGTMSMDVFAFQLPKDFYNEHIEKVFLISENLNLEEQVSEFPIYNFLTSLNSLNKQTEVISYT
jgi:alanine racemase